MQDLRPTTNCYWYLRQLRNRLAKDFPTNKLTPFRVNWCTRRISAIGEAIMKVRAMELLQADARKVA